MAKDKDNIDKFNATNDSNKLGKKKTSIVEFKLPVDNKKQSDVEKSTTNDNDKNNTKNSKAKIVKFQAQKSDEIEYFEVSLPEILRDIVLEDEDSQTFEMFNSVSSVLLSSANIDYEEQTLTKSFDKTRKRLIYELYDKMFLAIGQYIFQHVDICDMYLESKNLEVFTEKMDETAKCAIFHIYNNNNLYDGIELWKDKARRTIRTAKKRAIRTMQKEKAQANKKEDQPQVQ